MAIGQWAGRVGPLRIIALTPESRRWLLSNGWVLFVHAWLLNGMVIMLCFRRVLQPVIVYYTEGHSG
jgi:hypothetical protein